LLREDGSLNSLLLSKVNERIPLRQSVLDTTLHRDPSSLNNKSYLNQTYMQHGCGKTMLKENAFENQLK
jgi:hypothetical protein